MTDRTAAEVMCCPDGCEKDTMPRLRGECHASAFVRLTEIIHAAGYMIVPREPTERHGAWPHEPCRAAPGPRRWMTIFPPPAKW